MTQPNAAQKLAVLPAGVWYPEGIATNPGTGDVYVGTFDFGTADRPADNKLLRLNRIGKVIAEHDYAGQPLLGLTFDADHGYLYIANMGASKIQRIPANFTDQTAVVDVATIPGIGAPADREVANPDGSADTVKFGSNSFPAPNGMAFDPGGNLYVSDSFQGAIFRIDDPANCAGACTPELVAHDPLLATAGHPPFGANGLAFNADQSALFIANTGDDRVLKLDLHSKTLSVFAESVNGADGLAFDDRGRLWVAANQADELVALNENGRVVASLGEFQGINRDGSPDGLLFPASLSIQGRHILVTNLALPLTGAVGDEPEEDATSFTVSRLQIP
ncbi:MAG: SMP-30/gluconolactonase/LRE family protein [Candidatus Nanopelagicales bacterium]